MSPAPFRGCLIAALSLVVAAPDAGAERAVCAENATIGELGQALAAGDTTAAALVQAYLARIAAYDRAGPRLDAVRELNPDAPAIAVQSDARGPAQRRPLEGIPILIKDNIATADAQHTTAGSLALEEREQKTMRPSSNCCDRPGQ